MSEIDAKKNSYILLTQRASRVCLYSSKKIVHKMSWLYLQQGSIGKLFARLLKRDLFIFDAMCRTCCVNNVYLSPGQRPQRDRIWVWDAWLKTPTHRDMGDSHDSNCQKVKQCWDAHFFFFLK